MFIDVVLTRLLACLLVEQWTAGSSALKSHSGFWIKKALHKQQQCSCGWTDYCFACVSIVPGGGAAADGSLLSMGSGPLAAPGAAEPSVSIPLMSQPTAIVQVRICLATFAMLCGFGYMASRLLQPTISRSMHSARVSSHISACMCIRISNSALALGKSSGLVAPHMCV